MPAGTYKRIPARQLLAASIGAELDYFNGKVEDGDIAAVTAAKAATATAAAVPPTRRDGLNAPAPAAFSATTAAAPYVPEDATTTVTAGGPLTTAKRPLPEDVTSTTTIATRPLPENTTSTKGTRCTLSDQEIQHLVTQRQQARRSKEYELADKIRDQLMKAGVSQQGCGSRGTTVKAEVAGPVATCPGFHASSHPNLPDPHLAPGYS